MRVLKVFWGMIIMSAIIVAIVGIIFLASAGGQSIEENGLNVLNFLQVLPAGLLMISLLAVAGYIITD